MNYTISDPESDWGLLREKLLWQRQVRVPSRVPPILTMSADGRVEPGATMNGTPRSDDDQDSRPHDYGPSFYASIQATTAAVVGVLAGRPRMGTGIRGRRRSQGVNDQQHGEEPKEEPGRPLTPTRRGAPAAGDSGGSSPVRRRLTVKTVDPEFVRGGSAELSQGVFPRPV